MAKELLENIIKTLDEKKAKDIGAIEITEVTIIADYFVIATGTSSTHLKSLANDLEHALEGMGYNHNGIEGRATGWVLIDYGNVLVHLFSEEMRGYYNLERLWADANKLDISSLLTE